jgi:hypothetical protein
MNRGVEIDRWSPTARTRHSRAGRDGVAVRMAVLKPVTELPNA